MEAYIEAISVPSVYVYGTQERKRNASKPLMYLNTVLKGRRKEGETRNDGETSKYPC